MSSYCPPFDAQRARCERNARRDGAAGVRVTNITEDQTPGRRIHDPKHPQADADGYVTYHGRGDEVLKVGGRWLAPAEVEAVGEGVVLLEALPQGLLAPEALGHRADLAGLDAVLDVGEDPVLDALGELRAAVDQRHAGAGPVKFEGGDGGGPEPRPVAKSMREPGSGSALRFGGGEQSFF